ncbi:MAG: hypothetical protein QG650_159, partial [Patescibacteria group bacterium]|nr:hypothetical protein [Patescibacteria group bacterium]
MSPRCGTDIEFEEFRSGGKIATPERVLPSLPSIGGLEVPDVATREALVADLRGRTADEIFSILANSLAESRYGSAESVLRNVAF